MGQWLRLLRGQSHAVEDRLDSFVLCDEGEDFDFGTTESTQQRINLVDLLYHLGPTQPALPLPPAEFVIVLVCVVGSCTFEPCFSNSLCAGGVRIKTPVPNELLTGFRDVVGDAS